MHAVAVEILGRSDETSRQLMSMVIPQVSTYKSRRPWRCNARGWLACLLAVLNPENEVLLLKLRQRVGTGSRTTWRRVEVVDQNAEGVAFESGIQMIICAAP